MPKRRTRRQEIQKICRLCGSRLPCLECDLVNHLVNQRTAEVHVIFQRHPDLLYRSLTTPGSLLNEVPFDHREKKITSFECTPFQIIMYSSLPNSSETEALLYELFSQGYNPAWLQDSGCQCSDCMARPNNIRLWWHTVNRVYKWVQAEYQKQVEANLSFLPHVLVAMLIEYLIDFASFYAKIKTFDPP